MAEVLILLKDDENGEVVAEVKYSPERSADSPAHGLVADFVSYACLKVVPDAD